MNQYQKYLLGYGKNNYYDLVTKDGLMDGALENGRFVLRQNEDITIKDYILYICNDVINSVFAVEGSIETPVKQEQNPGFSCPGKDNRNRFYLPIDFDHKIDSIRIVFENNLADDLILPVEYVEADKEAYFAQKEKERKEALFAATAIKCSTGADLVNIYFQPCCEEYARTEITLYRDNQMLAKYTVDEDCFFKSIGGLAYGKYGFVLKQFDKSGKEILETEQMTLTIRGIGNGKPVVII